MRAIIFMGWSHGRDEFARDRGMEGVGGERLLGFAGQERIKPFAGKDLPAAIDKPRQLAPAGVDEMPVSNGIDGRNQGDPNGLPASTSPSTNLRGD